MPFEYSAEQIAAIEIAISKERFQNYLRAAGGSRRLAVQLYERNTSLAEGLYGVIQSAEIALRNKIHATLTAGAGATWFDAIPFVEPQSLMILDAKSELRNLNRDVTPGAVVAELRCGFWTSLVSAKYEKSLWVPYLHRAFPHALQVLTGKDGNQVQRPLNRAAIHEKLEALRILRNRIAHHEPIHKLDLWAQYSDTMKVISWICPITADWTRETNCFPKRFHQNKVQKVQHDRHKSVHPMPGKPTN